MSGVAPSGVWTELESPVGPLRIWRGSGGLTAVEMEPLPPADPACRQDDDPLLTEARRQLTEYFAGERRHFELALDPEGTPFQKRVWALLRQIPWGQTTTYGALATELGDVKAVRAVGLANGRNPLAVVIPCHRVIGASGALIGYAGGLERKRWLLHHEGWREGSGDPRQLGLFGG